MGNFEPGELFAGRYKIVRRLGAGGMGAVYLACDPLEPEFLVALKVLNPGQAQNPTARERFRNEITASYKINHPHVVRAFEYFDAEDTQAYAMEHIDGGALLERMAAGIPGIPEATTILLQLTDALAAIHAAGIIHRDLKPENIMLTRRGDVKVTDFGVARLRDAKTLTGAGMMVGTPKYLAPEYIEIGECDARGDLFAVGVIAYELLTKVAPFGNEVTPAKMLERLKTTPIPARERNPEIPQTLANIIMRALETRVAKRFQSAREMHEALSAFAASGYTDSATAVTTSEEATNAPIEISSDEETILSPSAPETSAEETPGFFTSEPLADGSLLSASSEPQEPSRPMSQDTAAGWLRPTYTTTPPAESLENAAWGLSVDLKEGLPEPEITRIPSGSSASPSLQAFSIEDQISTAAPAFEDLDLTPQQREAIRGSRLRRAAPWLAATLTVASIAFIGVAQQALAPSIAEFPAGAYIGTAHGIFGAGSVTPIGIIKDRHANIFVLGRSGCAPTAISPTGGEILCGEMKFTVSVSAVNDQSAVGTIRETSWGTEGTWSASYGKDFSEGREQ